MEELRGLIGREVELERVCAVLRDTVVGLGPLVVGAHHVTCSDESEVECIEVFQRRFVEPLLPALAPEKKSAFRTSNLGSRYEWGAARIAEQHYATPASREMTKCIIIKVNGHVSVLETPDGVRYGPMDRYNTQSSACGALHALLADVREPFTDDLRAAFTVDGNDRIATLLDERRVEPLYRYLFAAIVSARLQATRAQRDVQQHKESTPTLYLIVPCVTLNRPGPDSEIVVGYHVADYRRDDVAIDYTGLGDDPARYRVISHDGPLRIRE